MASREFTQKEVQEQFMLHAWSLVKYWAEEPHMPTVREKLEGLLHSFLTMLDGLTTALPAFDVIPHPHEDDKSYCVKAGADYFRPFMLPEDVIAVHGDDLLNDLMHAFGREHGFLPREAPDA